MLRAVVAPSFAHKPSLPATQFFPPSTPISQFRRGYGGCEEAKEKENKKHRGERREDGEQKRRGGAQESSCCLFLDVHAAQERLRLQQFSRLHLNLLPFSLFFPFFSLLFFVFVPVPSSQHECVPTRARRPAAGHACTAGPARRHPHATATDCPILTKPRHRQRVRARCSSVQAARPS